MSVEVPLQYDLFTHELVDTRSDHQRRLDREREQPRQQELFPLTEVVQFGQRARPWLANVPIAPLTLEIQDLRTEEERDRDEMRAAEQLTQPLFAEAAPTSPDHAADTIVDGQEGTFSVALFHVGKEELVQARPDLEAEIRRLSNTDIEAIALRTEEAMRSIFSIVLKLTLSTYLIPSNEPKSLPNKLKVSSGVINE
jgi:hypothetical protein